MGRDSKKELKLSEFDFSIHRSSLVKNHKHINWTLLEEALFILPDNDGEAKRACQILKSLAAPHVHISKQGWGAVLDKEIDKLSVPLSKKIKSIVVFEMPGRLNENQVISSEQSLRDRGYDVIIIDHHYYHWVDRYCERSSLEQLCQLIGWPLSLVDEAISVNDRSYIPGMKKMGLSNSQIIEIRTYDLLAQGFQRPYIQSQTLKAQEEIQRFKEHKKGDLWLVEDLRVERVFFLQELALRSLDGVVHVLESAPHKLGFSGNPAVVKELMTLDFEPFNLKSQYVNYSGGDEKFSKFWVFRMLKGKAIPSQLRAKFNSIINFHVNGNSGVR